MNRNNDPYDSSSYLSNDRRESIEEYQKKAQKVHREKEAFLHREFDFQDYIFAPEGFEGIMLFVYIMTIPYLVSLSFLFVFIAKSRYQYFLEFNLASYFVIWAIGYEICAVFAIIIFFYAWFTDNGSDDEPRGKRGVRPRFRN